MKKLLVLLCACLMLPVFAQDFDRNVFNNFVNVKFIRNHDGDTFVFDLGNNLPDLFRTMPVRLYGIDTPEVGTKNLAEKAAGIKARDFVTYEMKSAHKISLVECSKDKYFRLLCRVDYDGKDLTTELINRGYGYAYYGDKKNQDKINAVVKTIGSNK